MSAAAGLRRRWLCPALVQLVLLGVLKATWAFRAFLLAGGARSLRGPSCAGPAASPLSGVRRSARGGEEQQERDFQVGDKVRVREEDEKWYTGKIAEAASDGGWVVRWDDPMGGPETQAVEEGNMQKIHVFKDYKVADDCKAVSAQDGRWYPGVVVETPLEGKLWPDRFVVRWDDPDGGPETEEVDAEFMMRVLVFKGWQPGDEVLAQCAADGQMYDGTVVCANKDGTFQVKWDDAGDGDAEEAVPYKKMRRRPIAVDQLKVGQRYTGTVRSIRDFGAFVDIGAEAEGLLHISRIAKRKVNSIYDYLEEGQEVQVWICGVREDGKFQLTMVEGRYDRKSTGKRENAAAFEGIPSDQWLDGVVQGIRKYGCFVDVKHGDTIGRGLVPLRLISHSHVERVEDEVRVGQEVQVRVLKVDAGSGKLDLTMQTLHSPSFFLSVDASRWFVGKVAKVSSVGATVEVRVPEDDKTALGFLHVSKVASSNEGLIENLEDELTAGQEVKVRVLGSEPSGQLKLTTKSPD